jgi:hypothetical protein
MGRHPVAVVILHITYARTMKVDYCRFKLRRATWEACSGNLEKKITGTTPAFTLRPRKTKKTCVEMVSRSTFLRFNKSFTSFPIWCCNRGL